MLNRSTRLSAALCAVLVTYPSPVFKKINTFHQFSEYKRVDFAESAIHITTTKKDGECRFLILMPDYKDAPAVMGHISKEDQGGNSSVVFEFGETTVVFLPASDPLTFYESYHKKFLRSGTASEAQRQLVSSVMKACALAI